MPRKLYHINNTELPPYRSHFNRRRMVEMKFAITLLEEVGTDTYTFKVIYHLSISIFACNAVWRPALVVFCVRIHPFVNENFGNLNACSTVFIDRCRVERIATGTTFLRIDICTCRNQELDNFSVLIGRCCSMKCSAAPTVSGINIDTFRNEKFCDFNVPVESRSNMDRLIAESRTPRINICSF